MLGPVSTWMGDRLGTLGAVGTFAFSNSSLFPFLLSGVIRKGSPQYKGSSFWKFLVTFLLKLLQLVQFECQRHPNPPVSSISGLRRISLFSLLALWGNKNWPPIIKMKQIENCQEKMGCKWFSLNAPGTQNLFVWSFSGLEEFPYCAAKSNGEMRRHWPFGLMASSFVRGSEMYVMLIRGLVK